MYPCCEGGPGIIAKVDVKTRCFTSEHQKAYRGAEVPEDALGGQTAVALPIEEIERHWSMGSSHKNEELVHSEWVLVVSPAAAGTENNVKAPGP
jgi:hypothetical protein